MLPLQIGDLNEIMYFKARSEIERIDWMEAIRIGIIKKILHIFHSCIQKQQVDHIMHVHVHMRTL